MGWVRWGADQPRIPQNKPEHEESMEGFLILENISWWVNIKGHHLRSPFLEFLVVVCTCMCLCFVGGRGGGA